MQRDNEYTIDCREYAHKEDEGLLSSIKKDHSLVKYLYEIYSKEASEDNKTRVVNEIIRQISIHSAAEEIVVYPVIKDKLGEEEYNRSLSEHGEVKNDLNVVSSMLTHIKSEKFSNKFKKALEEFITHSEEEENKILPSLIEKLSDEENKNITKAFIEKRKTVPTRPHPSAPDTQPAENIVGAAAAPVDKLLDKASRSFPVLIM